MKKIVFLGSKRVGYRCLQFMAENAGPLDIEIAGVLTNDTDRFGSDFSIKKLSGEKGLRVLSSLDDLLAIGPVDILVSIQYHEILQQKHIDTARQIAINLHMAPLPEYRGCNQFSFAIINGDTTFGTTIHRLEAGIDNGDILFEDRFPLPGDCFVNELVDLTTERSVELFCSKFGKIVAGEYTLTAQSSFRGERKNSFHLRHEINDLKKIDLSWPREKIERHIRATLMPGFEPPFLLLSGRKIYFNFDRNKQSD